MTGGGNIYPSAPEYQSTAEKGHATGGYQGGSGMGQALVPKGHNPEWTTTLVSCDRPLSVCLYAYFCPNCAMATMRTEYDGSNWLFNCLALNPVIARNMLRSGYNIEGSVGGDICLPLFCGPCVTAQMLHEVRTRGPIKNVSQPNTEQWRHGLFSFDLMACLFGWCLPNCGMAAARENYDGSSFLLNCCCLTPVLGRNLVREGYGIEGSCCGDICASMWLGPCVVSQLYQETKSRGRANHTSAPGTHYMK